MSDRSGWLFRARDVVEAIRQIEESVADHKNAGSFYADWESFRAVERNLQIIAEASKGIPDQIKKEFAQIEWRQVVDMRNFLVHEYKRVDEDIMWDAVHKDIPRLKAVVDDVLKKYEGKTK
jgi:uncharacterized protein with HEPN domain